MFYKLWHTLQMISFAIFLNPSFANHHLIMHFVGNLISLIRGGEELENFYKEGMYTEFFKKGRDLVKRGVPSFSH